MAAITSAVGIGSGIDINGTISQITAAEGKPQLAAIAAKETLSQTKLSGLGTLKGALSTFQNAVKGLTKSTAFNSQVITSSDEKVFTVKVDPGTTASSHNIKVNSIAQPQKSVSSAEFKSTDTVKAGSIIFNDNTGAPKFLINIETGVNDTLAGLRDAINNAKDNNSIVASIINVDSKSSPGTTVSKLVLTSKTPGTENSFSIDASLGDDKFTLSDAYPTNYSTSKAVDTNVIIDAQKVEASPQRSVANKEFTENDVVAAGTLKFKDSAGLEMFSVTIEEGVNDKLFAAMDAINNAPGNSRVTASVINVESKLNPGTIVSKLVFTAKQPGTDNAFTIDASLGDPAFSLGETPANAQKTTFSAEFSENAKVAPGTLAFKDSSGEVKFSIDITATTSTTVKEDGSPLDLDIFDEPILTDENGELIPTKVITTNGNDSLEELVEAINYAPENDLVVASIETTTSSTDPDVKVSRLVLTALKGDQSFTVDGSAGDTRLTLDPTEVVEPDTTPKYVSARTAATFETTDAGNENDGGQSVTTSSTTIVDAIPGTTLTVLSVGSADISSHTDTTSISKPISAFVDAYNKLNETLKFLTNYVAPGDSNNGPLLGDENVKNVISQIKRIINSNVSSTNGEFKNLNQLGITFDKKGVMSLDSSKLDTALNKNLSAVSDLFASTNGVAKELDTKLSQFLDAKGPLSSLQDTLNKNLIKLAADRNAVNERLTASQKSLQKQFIAMDTAVSQFKNTGTFLTQFVASQTKTTN